MGNEEGDLALEAEAILDIAWKIRRKADLAASGGVARPRRRRFGLMRCPASGDSPP
jgi:hypothetical protein